MTTETVPFPAGIHDMPSGELFRILALRAFELSKDDAGRQQVLGAILGAMEEDRLMISQVAQNQRLEKLQAHELAKMSELEDAFGDGEETEDDDGEDDGPPIVMTLIRVDSDEDDDFDEEDGENA